MNLALQSVSRHKVVAALACIPVFDCVFNQVSNSFHLTVGPLTVLEVFRGALLLLFVLLCFLRLSETPSSIKRIPIAAMGGFLMLAIVITKEFALTGSVATESIVAYGQMIYWLIFWITISLRCTDAIEANLILHGIGIGALLTALSVFLGLALGANNYYQSDAVHSSSGWFVTAKMITGILVTGGVVLLYLGRNRNRWLYAAAAACCFLACVLTYARAGTVAIIVVVLWLSMWMTYTYYVVTWAPLKRFLAITGAAFVALLLFIPPSTMFARWSDLSDDARAGSGRASIWRVALEDSASSPVTTQLLGRGYAAMSDLLLTDYGDDVKHTHNDLLDMLLVAGVVGIAWYSLFLLTWIKRLLRSSLWTIEGAASLAIFLGFLCHAQLTGQLWGTDSMTYYMLSLSSLDLIRKKYISTDSVGALNHADMSLPAPLAPRGYLHEYPYPGSR